MKQTIEIEVPDGKKAVWKDNKVVFEDIKKPQLPKTWEEFCEQNRLKSIEYFLTNSSCPQKSHSGKRLKYLCKNVVPSKQAALAHRALMQLHQLRDCYRQEWLPDWSNEPNKYCIVRSYNSITKRMELMIVDYDSTPTFLSFQTRKLAKEFLTNFRELIEEAGDLI